MNPKQNCITNVPAPIKAIGGKSIAMVCSGLGEAGTVFTNAVCNTAGIAFYGAVGWGECRNAGNGTEFVYYPTWAKSSQQPKPTEPKPNEQKPNEQKPNDWNSAMTHVGGFTAFILALHAAF